MLAYLAVTHVNESRAEQECEQVEHPVLLAASSCGQLNGAEADDAEG